MTMRVPAAFIFRRSSVVTGLGASDMGGRQRVELHDLALPEITVRQLGMRYGELRRRNRTVAEADDIQVQRTRPPAFSALPPRLHFDRAALLQQLARLERRHQQYHLIEEGPLLDGPERRRFLDARGGDKVGPAHGRQAQPSVREVGLAVPEIRSEGDVGPLEVVGHSTLANPRVRSRSRPATSSRSRVARSRSVSPVAASPARAETPSASARFCNEIAATALMRWRSRSNAASCSPALEAMR